MLDSPGFEEAPKAEIAGLITEEGKPLVPVLPKPPLAGNELPPNIGLALPEF
jgi:hypothetical protein